MPCSKSHERKLPFDPLRRMMNIPGWTEPSEQNRDGRMTYAVLSDISGIATGTIARYSRSGRLPMSDADRIACALGFHPILLWSDFQNEPHHPKELHETAQLFDPDADR